MRWEKERRGRLGLARGLLARVARKGGRRVIYCESLLHRDRGHKMIALTVHRAQEARRPSPLPQYLAQRPHTGGQRLVTDKRVGPQLPQEFLLGDDPRAMRQQIGEYLKHLAPDPHRYTRVLQLLALSIKDIVTKAVPHRPAFSAPGCSSHLGPSGE